MLPKILSVEVYLTALNGKIRGISFNTVCQMICRRLRALTNRLLSSSSASYIFFFMLLICLLSKTLVLESFNSKFWSLIILKPDRFDATSQSSLMLEAIRWIELQAASQEKGREIVYSVSQVGYHLCLVCVK